jgi:hypothetical protein
MLSDSRFQIPRFTLALFVFPAFAIAAAQQPAAVRWFKGNTHTPCCRAVTVGSRSGPTIVSS